MTIKGLSQVGEEYDKMRVKQISYQATRLPWVHLHRQLGRAFPLVHSFGYWVLMLGSAALPSPSADGFDASTHPLDLGPVRAGRQLDQGVQWDVHPGAGALVLLSKVGVNTSENGLVGDYENILRPLQLHDDGLQSNDHVPVRLAPTVTIVVLVLVASLEISGVNVLDFLVGHAIAHAGVKLVECLPLELVVVWR